MIGVGTDNLLLAVTKQVCNSVSNYEAASRTQMRSIVTGVP